jgi:hypothetical protein
MLWTWGWARKESSGNLQFGYASSKDLVTWSAQRAIPVMQEEPTARNAWAPEAVYDPASKEWILFWSTTIPGRFPTTEAEGDSGYNHRVYSMTTRDWKTFEPVDVVFPADHRHGTVAKIPEVLAKMLRAMR